MLTLLLAIIAYASAYSFTADMELRAPYLKNGVIIGKFMQHWPTDVNANGYQYISYTNQGYFEVHEFNKAKGYNFNSAQFASQWNYRVGQTCGCETGALDYVLPPMSATEQPDAGKLKDGWTGPTPLTKYGKTFDSYTIAAGKEAQYGGIDSYASTVAFDSTGKPALMIFEDGREFYFTNVQEGVDTSKFAPPPGCKCGRPIDIVIVLDRSGSINAVEWVQQKDFVLGFVQQFEFGPLGANIAIVNFNKIYWTTLTLAQGSTKDNTYNTIASMRCCDTRADDYKNNPDISCCCCGTSVSGGMEEGAYVLKNSTTRPSTATKVMLTITDGYHNTQHNQAQCSTFPTPYEGSACRGDLYNTVFNIVEKVVPGIIMYGIGVGTEREFSLEEMVICAQLKPERVLTASNFAELATKTLELVARTCDENTSPCGVACCGFCVCSQCQKVDKCDDPTNKCQLSSVPEGKVCCETQPKKCPASSPCVTYACVDGDCPGTPVPLPADTQCKTWKCDPVAGPVSQDLNCTGPPEPDCKANTDCNDKNPCTEDICDTNLALAKCRFNPIDCTKQAGFAPDKCSEIDCDIVQGCRRTNYSANFCDDNNVCTKDYCDLQRGCVHDPIPLEKIPGCENVTLCQTAVCHPTLGCVISPKVCNISLDQIAREHGKKKEEINRNCTVGFCEKGACRSRLLDCPVPFNTIVGIGAGLGAAALAGIIVAAVLVALGVAGGGAYAYSQAAGGGGLAVVGNNPIFVGNQAAGMNPLYVNA